MVAAALLGNIGFPLQLKRPHVVVVFEQPPGGGPGCTEVSALIAVPLVLTPMLGKFAPRGFDGENVVTGFILVMMEPAARTTVLPLPLTSHATPTRGSKSR